MADVDDPADSFEYDEFGCLVQLTPEAFDFFMLAQAGPGRVGEVLKRLRGCQERLQAEADDPYVEAQRDAIRRLLADIEERLQSPITQLGLMRLSVRIEGAVKRFRDERDQEHRVSRWVEF